MKSLKKNWTRMLLQKIWVYKERKGLFQKDLSVCFLCLNLPAIYICTSTTYTYSQPYMVLFLVGKLWKDLLFFVEICVDAVSYSWLILFSIEYGPKNLYIF